MSKTTKKAVYKQKKCLILLTLTSFNTQFVTPTQSIAQFDTRALIDDFRSSLKSLGFKNIRNRFTLGESSKKLAKKEEENEYKADAATEDALAALQKKAEHNINQEQQFTRKETFKPMETIEETDYENRKTYMPTRSKNLEYLRSYGRKYPDDEGENFQNWDWDSVCTASEYVANLSDRLTLRPAPICVDRAISW